MGTYEKETPSKGCARTGTGMVPETPQVWSELPAIRVSLLGALSVRYPENPAPMRLLRATPQRLKLRSTIPASYTRRIRDPGQVSPDRHDGRLPILAAKCWITTIGSSQCGMALGTNSSSGAGYPQLGDKRPNKSLACSSWPCVCVCLSVCVCVCVWVWVWVWVFAFVFVFVLVLVFVFVFVCVCVRACACRTLECCSVATMVNTL